MEPSLATSWETSEDDLTWTFTLRDGVTFHDGSEFDSADVVYSYNRIIDEELTNSYRFANVASVEAPDPQTVVITLTQPTPNLLALIGAFKGMAILPEDAAEDLDLTTEANGTGPFELDELRRQQHRADRLRRLLGRRAERRRRRVPLHHRAGRGAHRAAERRGAVDRQRAAAADRVPGRRRRRSSWRARASVDYWYMAMNYARPPFDDPTVRQAIASAVDREAVAEAARFGAARANQTAIPEDSFFYYDYAPFDRDPDAARAAAASEAGVRRRSPWA